MQKYLGRTRTWRSFRKGKFWNHLWWCWQLILVWRSRNYRAKPNGDGGWLESLREDRKHQRTHTRKRERLIWESDLEKLISVASYSVVVVASNSQQLLVLALIGPSGDWEDAGRAAASSSVCDGVGELYAAASIFRGGCRRWWMYCLA